MLTRKAPDNDPFLATHGNGANGKTYGRLTRSDGHLSAWLRTDPAPKPRRTREPRPPGTLLLAAASVLLLGLAAAQGYVSWKAQFTFIHAEKHQDLPATLEALGLDIGAVIFALLGLAHARMGRPARVERILNLACAFGSMTMNLLGADLASPRSIAVYVMPAVLYAACSDRLIATAGHMAGVQETSLWKWVGVAMLYGLRACLALPSTATGLRLRLLELTPLPTSGAAVTGNNIPSSEVATLAPVTVPDVPHEPHISQGNFPEPIQGPRLTKKSRLLALYATHPDRGVRAKVSAVATELAPQADLDPRSARSYLYAHVDGGKK